MKKLLFVLVLFFFTNQSMAESIDFNKNEIIEQCQHGKVLPKITTFKINIVHHKTTSEDGCLIVKENNNNPAKSNQRSVKITVHPDFCSRDEGWNDCTTDRSRVEFYDAEGVKSNKKVVYDYSIYIPKDMDIIQSDNSIEKNNQNVVILSQLNTTTTTMYKSLVYLRWTDSDGLFFETFDKFNWKVSKRTKIPNLSPESQKGRWIDISYEVEVHPNKKGKLKIYADNKLVYERYNHRTIKKYGKISLKLGIYNYFLSKMKHPRSSQYVYYDNIKKTVTSF